MHAWATLKDLERLARTRMNNRNSDNIMLQSPSDEYVDNFCYLSRIMISRGDSKIDENNSRKR